MLEEKTSIFKIESDSVVEKMIRRFQRRLKFDHFRERLVIVSVLIDRFIKILMF